MCDCKTLPTQVWRKYATGASLGADAGDNLANWARQCAEIGFHGRLAAAALLRVHVDEIGRAGGGLEEIPALHPVVSALEFIRRDRRRIDQIETAFA